MGSGFRPLYVYFSNGEEGGERTEERVERKIYKKYRLETIIGKQGHDQTRREVA